MCAHEHRDGTATGPLCVRAAAAREQPEHGRTGTLARTACEDGFGWVCAGVDGCVGVDGCGWMWMGGCGCVWSDACGWMGVAWMGVDVCVCGWTGVDGCVFRGACEEGARTAAPHTRGGTRRVLIVRTELNGPVLKVGFLNGQLSGQRSDQVLNPKVSSLSTGLKGETTALPRRLLWAVCAPPTVLSPPSVGGMKAPLFHRP
jgi:hypothetical protein